MPTINGKVCIVNGTPVDKVFSNGRQVYGRNMLTGTSTPVQVTGNGPPIIYLTSISLGVNN